MKKVLLIVILLCTVISNCLAFEPPTDLRWIWLGSDDKMGLWIDSETVQFHNDTNEPGHFKHSCAKCWVLSYKTDDNTHSMIRCEIDFDCQLMRFLSATIYNDDNTIKNNFSNKYSNFEEVVPGTYGEAIYLSVKAIRDGRKI